MRRAPAVVAGFSTEITTDLGLEWPRNGQRPEGTSGQPT
jgi:hypothetical protein